MQQRIFFQASGATVNGSLMTEFISFVSNKRGASFTDYSQFESFALQNNEDFWEALLEWSRKAELTAAKARMAAASGAWVDWSARWPMFRGLSVFAIRHPIRRRSTRN